MKLPHALLHTLAAASLCSGATPSPATIIQPPPDPAALLKAKELVQILPLEVVAGPGTTPYIQFEILLDGQLEEFARQSGGQPKDVVAVFKAKVRQRIRAVWPQMLAGAREILATEYAHRLKRPEEIEAATTFFHTPAGQTYFKATMGESETLVQALNGAIRGAIGRAEYDRLLLEAVESAQHMRAANAPRSN